MALAYIALGSNLGDPPVLVRSALRSLSTAPDLKMTAQSSLYRSAPLGPAGQQEYCNAVCAVETALTPLALLARLQAIETDFGRTRDGPRWGARTLDLDMLLYDDLSMDTPTLRLPHPQLLRRNFVLAPLAEIASTLIVPGAGKVSEHARQAGTQGLSLWIPAAG